jgi:hypothetical protein
MASIKDRLIKELLDNFFKIRYFFIICCLGFIIYIGLHLRHQNAPFKDIVSVVTGCALSITLLYSILTYEHNQIKYKSESKNARDLLTFTTAVEWHRPPLVDYVISIYTFAEANKSCLEEKSAKKFHELLEHEDNKEARKALVAIFNYMESISLGVKQELMDEHFIKGFFGSIFGKYYFEYHFYIEYRRSIRNNMRIWNNFTTLAERWVKE